ncbi:MAG TPA: helix-turn-helix domain-containing protein [Solirubrobacteraceae bacterium]|jgi:hypothetical protein|nr:helix-turn-helix domain-containing protein [Solirubrobacteraceae bacterium]
MRSGPGSVDQARAGVAGRLRVRRVELVEAIFARVREGALGRAGGEDADYVAGLRAAVAAAVEHGLEGIERGEEWVGPAPPAVLEQAGRAARVGVSLDTVLRRYVVGHTLLGEFVVDEVDRGELSGRHSALRGVWRAQAAVLDRLLTVITGEYRAELVRARRSPQDQLAERVRRLLDGGAAQPTELDYEFDGWHVGAIAMGAGNEELVRALAARAERRLLSVAPDEQRVWAWLGGRDRLEVADLERVIANTALSGGVAFAVGEPAKGFEGWRLTHRQAQAALLVALRRPRALTRYADVALLANVLKDDALVRALTDIYLSPLNDAHERGPVLRETLRAYLAAERNASSTAAMLKVARRTVENRLRTIEAKLGRSLHPCPAELEVALHLDALGLVADDPSAAHPDK